MKKGLVAKTMSWCGGLIDDKGFVVTDEVDQCTEAHLIFGMYRTSVKALIVPSNILIRIGGGGATSLRGSSVGRRCDGPAGGVGRWR